MRAREFVIPLQAFLGVTICVGMVWMIYAMAFFDPTPPTAAEIRFPATDDPRINEAKTAAVSTVNALFLMPTQILLATSTPTFTPTHTATITASPTPTATNTPTRTPRFIIVLSPTRAESSDPPVVNPPAPTSTFTPQPTEEPTEEPTIEPTEEPTEEPTDEPTAEPTVAPTEPSPTEPPVIE